MADIEENSSGSSVEAVPLPEDYIITSHLPNNGLPTLLNGVSGDVCMDGVSEQQPIDNTQPRLIVSEHPQSRGFRFRYKCEGPSHGGLQGVSSQKHRKTYPSVRILNYKGPARIIVTLVTDDIIPKIHAHELVGKNCQNGICVVDLKGNEHRSEFKFQNLGIMHVTKKNVKAILQERIVESMKLDKMIKMGQLDNSDVSLKTEEFRLAKEQADKDAKSMQLSVVRLCFQAYLVDHQGQFSRLLPSVLSEAIFDSKSPGAAALKICRMDKYGGCCTGNEEVFLLCEKVQKDDISVRFVEKDDDGNTIWEASGNFGPNDVHRQFAIVFKTPPYRDRNIQKAVTVQIQLKRNTDEELSDPKSFTYYPEDSDKEGIVRKRRKRLPGMGPPSYNPGDGHSDGGHGYGSANDDRSNGPYYDSRPQGEGGYSYAGQTGQQYHLNPDTTHKGPKMSDNETMEQQQKLPSHTRNKHGSQSDQKTKLSDSDLETDTTPYQDDFKDGVFGSGKIDNQKSDSIDAGFYSQDFSSHSTGEETKIRSQQMIQDVKCKKEQQSVTCTAARSTMPADNLQAKDKAILKVVQRTTQALQEYAVTGDARALLMAQRHLTFMTDENGDLILKYGQCCCCSPLHLAIINKQESVVKELLSVMSTISDAGRKINAYNHLHQTPLHLAVLTGQIEIIDTLLRYGANPALEDRHGNTPAHLATKNGDEACVKALTKYLRPGVTREKPFPELDIFNYEGLTPIHLAAISSNLNTLQAVCVRRANINLQDGKSGRTPLHYIVESGDLSLAGYILLEAGADPNSRTFDGNTPLHIACGRSMTGMVALLMAAGADPDLENDDIGYDPDSDYEDEDNIIKHNIIDYRNADQSEENEDEGIELRGMTPKDLAAEDKKIMRILNGEPYGSLQGLTEPPPFAHSPILQSVTESGFGSFFGELWFLDHSSRVRLSKLLDPVDEGSDWYTLADFLGYTKYTESFENAASPTRALLDKFEGSCGTFDQLREALVQMHREDAVSLINRAVKDYQHELIRNNSLTNFLPRSGSQWTDSGISGSRWTDSGISDSLSSESTFVGNC